MAAACSAWAASPSSSSPRAAVMGSFSSGICHLGMMLECCAAGYAASSSCKERLLLARVCDPTFFGY